VRGGMGVPGGAIPRRGGRNVVRLAADHRAAARRRPRISRLIGRVLALRPGRVQRQAQRRQRPFGHRWHQRQPKLELWGRGRCRRVRRRHGVAQAAGEELLRPAHVGQWHAECTGSSAR
jgi:hypothetical protein